jgi:hypothetical protein
MPKLNQILAIEKGTRKNAYATLTRLNKTVQKGDLCNGFHKTFNFLDEEETSRIPDEVRKPQFTYEGAFREAELALADLFDVTATKDIANCTARADIVVDGHILMSQVPVTHLLFLEKQLSDLHTFVGNVSELPTDQNWTLDGNTGQHAANPPDTIKTKKVKKHSVVVPATEHHPAQVAETTEDVVVGHWSTTLYSGAIPTTRKKEILGRIITLSDAVKFAREEANSIDVTQQTSGGVLLGFIFSGTE